MEETINLDSQMFNVTYRIFVSRLEVENWPGGIDKMLAAKTEHIRDFIVEAAQNEIRERGWVAK